MKIKFFDKNGCIDSDAIYAGVYQFKIGLLDDSEDKYLSLYIGESYSMISRCSNHLYEVFHTDPSYFGLKTEDLKNGTLQLIVEVYKKVSIPNGTTNSERDILLRTEEESAIKKLGSLSQLSESDNLKKNRVEVVEDAIKKLLNK